MLKTALIGHTGFVGGNIARQFVFDDCYNSRNIGEIRGREYDSVICAGVSAVKWWANKNADEDRSRIDALLADLTAIRANRVVVLSTVDVYPVSSGVDEAFECHGIANHAYGANRLYFEDVLKRYFENVTIVRISGVFGPGLKKNVIFDLLNDNCLSAINPASSFQYYNVANLWRDLERVRQLEIPLINFVGAPIQNGEIIERFFPGKRVGETAGPVAHYDVHTQHSAAFGGPPNYLAHASDVMGELGAFIAGESHR